MDGVVSEDPGRPTAQAQDLVVLQAGILVRDQQHLRTRSDSRGDLGCPKMWASFSASFYKPTHFLFGHSLTIFTAPFYFLFLFFFVFTKKCI